MQHETPRPLIDMIPPPPFTRNVLQDNETQPQNQPELHPKQPARGIQGRHRRKEGPSSGLPKNKMTRGRGSSQGYHNDCNYFWAVVVVAVVVVVRVNWLTDFVTLLSVELPTNLVCVFFFALRPFQLHDSPRLTDPKRQRSCLTVGTLSPSNLARFSENSPLSFCRWHHQCFGNLNATRPCHIFVWARCHVPTWAGLSRGSGRPTVRARLEK